MSEPTWVGIVAALIAGIFTRLWSGWQTKQQIERHTAPRIRREAKEDVEGPLREVVALLKEALADLREARTQQHEALMAALKDRPNSD